MDQDNRVVDHMLGGLPDRIVYVAHVDTELDLSGLTVVFILGNGTQRDQSLYTYSHIIVNHNIDFSTPGVYEVEIIFPIRMIRANDLSLRFLVQVIDDTIYNHIREGTFNEIKSPTVWATPTPTPRP
jgi:hypothetical protein